MPDLSLKYSALSGPLSIERIGRRRVFVNTRLCDAMLSRDLDSVMLYISPALPALEPPALFPGTDPSATGSSHTPMNMRPSFWGPRRQRAQKTKPTLVGLLRHQILGWMGLGPSWFVSRGGGTEPLQFAFGPQP